MRPAGGRGWREPVGRVRDAAPATRARAPKSGDRARRWAGAGPAGIGHRAAGAGPSRLTRGARARPHGPLRAGLAQAGGGPRLGGKPTGIGRPLPSPTFLVRVPGPPPRPLALGAVPELDARRGILRAVFLNSPRLDSGEGRAAAPYLHLASPANDTLLEPPRAPARTGREKEVPPEPVWRVLGLFSFQTREQEAGGPAGWERAGNGPWICRAQVTWCDISNPCDLFS